MRKSDGEQSDSSAGSVADLELRRRLRGQVMAGVVLIVLSAAISAGILTSSLPGASVLSVIILLAMTWCAGGWGVALIIKARRKHS